MYLLKLFLEIDMLPFLVRYLNQTGVYTVDGTNDTDDYHDLIVTLLLIFYKQISSKK